MIGSEHRLRLGGLVGLSLAGLVTMITEILPAAILRPMSLGLGTSEALIGQMVSVYALSSALGTIPLTAMTSRWGRKSVLLLALLSFALANMVAAVSDNLILTMLARLIAGLFGGLVWALLAGLAADLAPARQRGRAIAIAMAGVPIALACAIPAATYLETLVGWRGVFGAMALAPLLLAGWVAFVIERKAAPAELRHSAIRTLIADPQVYLILMLTALLISAHTALHTFIVPVVAMPHLPEFIPQALLLFGMASVVGTGVTSVVIDRYIAALIQAACCGLVLMALILMAAPAGAAVGVATLTLWGLAFGVIVPVLQTACNRMCAAAPDVGQAILVTVWNISIATGGAIGGVLLQSVAATSIAWFVFGGSLIALAIVKGAKPRGLHAERSQESQQPD